MARSLSGAATLADGITLLLKRRGYAAAAAATGRRGASAAEENTALRKVAEQYPSAASSASSSASNSWIPDPVTGYYRPANRRVEADAAELRAILLSHKH